MSHYLLSTGAADDLSAVWEFIAADSIDAADRWIDKLYETFELLALHPAMGHTRKDLTAHPVLFWPVESYLIIYRCQGGFIEIVAVTQGARDIPAFLQQRR
jgi:antitoxin ParD1/3/4